MKERTFKKQVYLTQGAIDQIDSVQKANGYRTIGEAVEHIIREGNRQDNQQLVVQAIAEQTAKLVKESIGGNIDIIRRRTGYSDISSKVLIELMNMVFIQMGIEKTTTTDMFEVPQIKQAHQKVRDDIASYKVKKADRQDRNKVTSNSDAEGYTENMVDR
ncbi:hypothetical protein [Listeria riparia]|uniref:Uncharacterized protein n=1 Tax=Listeria riparia FSL S10-1204 TaxID=1265816 RepID=W7D1M2_9LIST|nr:hypothetical protein [Listeria riparia]EUJ42870.1 hypothetical protein PRIP_15092 [Listeria riparia FSL S10-1204]